MELHVIVATKGRSRVLAQLLDSLTEQTVPPRSITIVGTHESDLAAAREHRSTHEGKVTLLVGERVGSCSQRNIALDLLSARLNAQSQVSAYAVVFFDDDYRPASDWLERCRLFFLAHPDVVGLSGQVLADGIHRPVSEAQARAYIDGALPPIKHWASGPLPRELNAVYGCNMAFRDIVASSHRFDENLPLYGWQDDQDYTYRAKRLGRVLYVPDCVGVHLGAKSGRVSGLRFGYSQIVNPWYLVRKGTMPLKKSLRFVSRHVVANTLKSLGRQREVDYAGRLRGNLIALRDLCRGRAHPLRVLELS
jgi:GT2 family glycosyltransferase